MDIGLDVVENTKYCSFLMKRMQEKITMQNLVYVLLKNREVQLIENKPKK